jgi:hypothetical protein
LEEQVAEDKVGLFTTHTPGFLLAYRVFDWLLKAMPKQFIRFVLRKLWTKGTVGVGVGLLVMVGLRVLVKVQIKVDVRVEVTVGVFVMVGDRVIVKLFVGVRVTVGE